MIFDYVRTPEYSESEQTIIKNGKSHLKTIKKFKYYHKEYRNKRWALYCSCGQMTEIPLGQLSNNDTGVLISNLPLLCNGCNKTYESLADVKMIYARNSSLNVTSKRFAVVEKNNSYALYSFATTVFVSVTTKKLMYKDIGCYSLYLSKKTDTIRIKTNDKIITVPFKYIVKHCKSIIDNMMANALCDSIMEQGIFERQVINPLIKFCEIVESKCDQRDVERVLALINKERDDAYINTLFKNLSKYPSDSLYISQRNCSYDIKSINDSDNNALSSRYVWIQYLKRRLCIMLTISVYPPMATLMLYCGPEKFLNLLSASSLMCSLTNLKKKKPTNPKDILETMFKGKITYELSKSKKIINYIRTEELKRKRKLKVHPEDKTLKNKITCHPTFFVDSRVPIFKDIKKELKKLHFRKFYVDLFLEKKFDEVAKTFYAILNNTSAFDEIATIDKIILNNTTKDAEQLIVGIQNIYEHNVARLGNFKMTYKYLCHYIKMVHSDKDPDKVSWGAFIQTYADTISMLQTMEIPTTDIFKAKNIESLNDMHNTLHQSYRLSLDKKLSEELKIHMNNYRHTEGIFDNIKIHLIDTPEKFYEESSVMNHCVKTYCTNVAKGNYVIYSLEDTETKDRATLSISVNSYLNGGTIENSGFPKYTFNQLKAKNNARSTERIMDAVKVFIHNFFNIKEYNNCYDLECKNNVKKLQPEDEVLIQNQRLNAAVV